MVDRCDQIRDALDGDQPHWGSMMLGCEDWDGRCSGMMHNDCCQGMMHDDCRDWCDGCNDWW